jgi:mono/diheme cytochrome c family protein
VGTLTHGDTREALRTVVRDGVPGTAMVAFGGILSDEQIDNVVQHLIALRKLPSH